MVTCLQAADTYLLDRKVLMFDAYFAVGEYKAYGNSPYNNVLFLNKVKKFNPKTIVVFDKPLNSLISFYTQNKYLSIKSDLTSSILPIYILNDYYNNVASDNDS